MSNFRLPLSTFFIFLTFFLLLFVYTKAAGPIPFSISSVNTNKNDTFNVSAEGSAQVKPDVAVVNVGIEASGTSVKEAQNQINQTINQVSEAIKKLGVDSPDIKTTYYNISPSYDYKSSSPKITGYRANTSLAIKVRNIDLVNQVVDQATANGANQVSGISFEVDDRTQAENAARQEAISQAKKKAESAARVAGFSLGRLINYNESFNTSGPQPLGMGAGGVGAAEKDVRTTIEPGSNEIKVIVTLSYEIR